MWAPSPDEISEAGCLAVAVRDALESLHEDYSNGWLQQTRMRELNTSIRNALLAGLVAIREAAAGSEEASRFLEEMRGRAGSLEN